MSPIEKTSYEVLATVLALGGKEAASKKLKIPKRTLSELINETYREGTDAERKRRVAFDTAILKKLSKNERRNISEFAGAFRRLMSPLDINNIKRDADKYAGTKRFKYLLKAIRSNRSKGYGLRLTTYNNPKRISLQVHRPKRRVSNAKRKTIRRTRRRGGKR